VTFTQTPASVRCSRGPLVSWALNEVPGNRLVVGTYFDGMFMVFDLKRWHSRRRSSSPARTTSGTRRWAKTAGCTAVLPWRQIGRAEPGHLQNRGPWRTGETQLVSEKRLPLCRTDASSASGMEDKRVTIVYDPNEAVHALAPRIGNRDEGRHLENYFSRIRRVSDATQACLSPSLPAAQRPKPSGRQTRPYDGSAALLPVGASLYGYTAGDKEPTFITDSNSTRRQCPRHLPAVTSSGSRGDYAVIRPGDHAA